MAYILVFINDTSASLKMHLDFVQSQHENVKSVKVASDGAAALGLDFGTDKALAQAAQRSYLMQGHQVHLYDVQVLSTFSA